MHHVGDDVLHKFGRTVAARRARLGLTRAEVHDAGGPSDTTLGYIENGTLRRSPSPSTLKKLDRALQWSTGSSADVLAGNKPTPIDAASVQPTTTPEKKTVVTTNDLTFVSMPMTEISRLLELHRQLTAACDGGELHAPLVREFQIAFNTYVYCLASITSTQIENAYLGGADASLPPIVELALAQLSAVQPTEAMNT